MKKSAVEGLVCPNCHTLNNPNAEICRSCGIHFQFFDEVNQELSQRVNERQDQLIKTIHEEAQNKLIADHKVLHKDFIKQLIIVILIGAALVPMIWGLLNIVQHQKLERLEFLKENYQKGITCLDAKDYRCANDYFQKVYNKEKGYQECLKLLLTTKIAIAEELFINGQISNSIEVLNTIISMDPQNIQARNLLDDYHKQLGDEYKAQESWQKAIDEYLFALEAMPDDFNARHKINEIYALWIKEATAKGDRFLVWQLKRQQQVFNDD